MVIMVGLGLRSRVLEQWQALSQPSNTDFSRDTSHLPRVSSVARLISRKVSYRHNCLPAGSRPNPPRYQNECGTASVAAVSTPVTSPDSRYMLFLASREEVFGLKFIILPLFPWPTYRTCCPDGLTYYTGRTHESITDHFKKQSLAKSNVALCHSQIPKTYNRRISYDEKEFADLLFLKTLAQATCQGVTKLSSWPSQSTEFYSSELGMGNKRFVKAVMYKRRVKEEGRNRQRGMEYFEIVTRELLFHQVK